MLFTKDSLLFSSPKFVFLNLKITEQRRQMKFFLAASQICYCSLLYIDWFIAIYFAPKQSYPTKAVIHKIKLDDYNFDP